MVIFISNPIQNNGKQNSSISANTTHPPLLILLSVNGGELVRSKDSDIGWNRVGS
jgi:hypothetical protein